MPMPSSQDGERPDSGRAAGWIPVGGARDPTPDFDGLEQAAAPAGQTVAYLAFGTEAPRQSRASWPTDERGPRRIFRQ